MCIFAGSNLLCWVIEMAADISALLTMRQDYLLAMVIQIGLSCGVTPLVYLVGAGGGHKMGTRVGPKQQ